MKPHESGGLVLESNEEIVTIRIALNDTGVAELAPSSFARVCEVPDTVADAKKPMVLPARESEVVLRSLKTLSETKMRRSNPKRMFMKIAQRAVSSYDNHM